MCYNAHTVCQAEELRDNLRSREVNYTVLRALENSFSDTVLISFLFMKHAHLALQTLVKIERIIYLQAHFNSRVSKSGTLEVGWRNSCVVVLVEMNEESGRGLMPGLC